MLGTNSKLPGNIRFVVFEQNYNVYAEKVTKRKSAELQRRFGMERGWSHGAFIDTVNSVFFSVTSVSGW